MSRRIPEQQEHNYRRQLFKQLDKIRDSIPPGAMGQLRVYHDDTCGIWSGRLCDCEAVLDLRIPKMGAGA